jgi:hypothetical protein
MLGTATERFRSKNYQSCWGEVPMPEFKFLIALPVVVIAKSAKETGCFSCEIWVQEMALSSMAATQLSLR